MFLFRKKTELYLCIRKTYSAMAYKTLEGGKSSELQRVVSEGRLEEVRA